MCRNVIVGPFVGWSVTQCEFLPKGFFPAQQIASDTALLIERSSYGTGGPEQFYTLPSLKSL